MSTYEEFLKAKAVVAPERGYAGDLELNPSLKPHARDIAAWMIRGGNRACFASYGLHKTSIQLQVCESILDVNPESSALIVCPLGVRREFIKEAGKRGFSRTPVYVSTNEDHAKAVAEGHRLFLTNYERVRDGQLDPNRFEVCSLDEASTLRSYGSKTYQEFLPLFSRVPFKFVATATPSPNRLKELIHYAGFLGIMDTGMALTRFFKRDPSKAGNLTLHPHKVKEFWLWVKTWAVFIQLPSDLGYDDTGYVLPEIKMIQHRIPADHATAGADSCGQEKMFRNAAAGLSAAAAEKRDSLDGRIRRAMEIIEAAGPDRHWIIWHDLEKEREALERAIPELVSITGSRSILSLEDREKIVERFADGEIRIFGTKPSLSGSGSNFQQHCYSNIFLGIGYKANDFMQALHRTQRFGQAHDVEAHLIYTEAEDPIYEELMRKIRDHNALHGTMSSLIREYGLNNARIGTEMERAIVTARTEVKGDLFTCVNSDNVAEMRRMPDNSIDLIVTSWPFSDHYEYTECYDEQTEILTRSGWKSFGSLTYDDLLATVNPQTLVMEWQAPQNIVWEAYTGQMVKFHARNSFDLLVTTNHNMFVNRRVGNAAYSGKQKRFELVSASKVQSQYEPRKWQMAAVPSMGDGIRLTHINIPRSRKRTMPNSKILKKVKTEDLLELAGWYVSEGHCGTDGLSRGAISISQSASVNPDNHAAIIALFGRIGLRCRPHARYVAASSVDLGMFLVNQFGAGSYSKKLPRWVMDLHPDLLTILRDTMMKGDGNSNGYAYTSYSKQLRDDFQEICLRTGWRTSICGNVVRIGQTNIFPEIRNAPETVEYSGMIGCATVPNHTLIVRRNGTPIISGNSYNDFGHNDGDTGFFAQMEYLTPEIIRCLKPGRMYCVHAKDRIVYGSVSGLGMYSVNRFSDKCADHLEQHGLICCGRITVVTDVVRENNQTYRLGWSENSKDGTKMGVGSPEYILLFRKLPTDRSNSYADEPVMKSKEDYTRARWQFDAHSFWRSSGNRFMRPEEMAEMRMDGLRSAWLKYSREKVYNFGEHVEVAQAMESRGLLPSSFMCLEVANPGAAYVWDDITRMRTLNSEQTRKGWENHVCLAVGSLVLTKERGYVPIQDVKTGESALTHKGRWRTVLAVQNTGVRPAITLRAQGVPGLTLTPDHKVWCRKSKRVREREGAEYVDPGWVESKDSLGGYVNFKLPAEEETADDPLDWWIVGRWLADGHWEARGGISISCGRHETDDLVKSLGIHAGTVRDTGTSHQISVIDSVDIRSIIEECGSGASGKHLPPEAFTLPVEQASALLAGYLSGDGYLLPERGRYCASSVSKNLALGIAFLAQKVYGTIASVYPGRPERDSEIQGRAVKCKQDWIICFDVPGSERYKQPFVLDDGAWKKVRILEDAGEVDTWNLRVDEDESFTAEGCIVKNCPLQLDIVERLIERYSNRGDVVLDPFGGLGTVAYSAILKGRRGYSIELNEDYWKDSLSYCRSAEQKVQSPTLFDFLEVEAGVSA